MKTRAGLSVSPVLLAAATLTRRLASFPGRWRVLRWIQEQGAGLQFLPPLAVDTEEGTRLIVEAYNNRDMYVDVDMFTKDDVVTTWFRRLLRPGDRVLDIGANIGRMSLLASRLVGPDGHIDAFEPCPKAIGSLWRNLQLNGASNVEVWPYAASDEVGSAIFHMPVGTNSGWASLRSIDANAACAIRVPTTTLDALAGEITGVRLVKIDVEGGEHKVLRGMRSLLMRDRPWVILELTDAWLRTLGSSADELLADMRQMRYSAYRLEPHTLGILVGAPAHQVDALFVPDERAGEVVAGA